MAERRWAFMSRKVIGPDDNPMLIRWRLIQTPLGGVYLHFIHREDLDRIPHDHPWVFRTLVVRGSYTEEYWADNSTVGVPGAAVVQTRRRFSWRKFPLTACHRIIKTTGRVTTLVFVGPKVCVWGFYNGTPEFVEFIPWTQYHQISGNEVW